MIPRDSRSCSLKNSCAREKGKILGVRCRNRPRTSKDAAKLRDLESEDIATVECEGRPFGQGGGHVDM